MSTTLITTQAQLQAWANSPTGTGQLQNDITVDATTWTIPNGNLASARINAGVLFDGNNKTIFLSNPNTTQVTFRGFFRLNGGTIQNFKLSTTYTAASTNGNIRPPSGGSYILPSNIAVTFPGTSGTITGVWVDGCLDNKLYTGIVTTPPSSTIPNSNVIGCSGNFTPETITVTNCQVGRSKDHPYVIYTDTTNQNASVIRVINGNITNCVMFVETINDASSKTAFGGFIGLSFRGTCGRCIFYWKNSSLQPNDTDLTATGTSGLTRFPASTANISDSYMFVDWNQTSSFRSSIISGQKPDGTSFPMGVSGGLTVSNLYVLVTLVNGNTFPSGGPYLFWGQPSSTFTVTNVAYPGTVTMAQDSTGFTVTNTYTTYTTSTSNTTEPINSFSSTYWNKTVQPPLLSFNSTSPWDSTNAVYDSPNVLTTFYTGGGGGGGDGGGGGGGGVICYGRGTRILMADGTEKVVEDIQAGDLVHTYKHGAKEVTLTYASEFFNNPKLWYRCMFENQETGLRITGSHRIAVRELANWQMKTYQASGLPLQRLDDELILLHSTVAVDMFKPVRSSNKFEIFHFALSDEPDEIFGVYANGILTESVPKKLIDEEIQNGERPVSVAVEKEVIESTCS